MPQKTFYFREIDLPIIDKLRQVSKLSVSSTLVNAAKAYIDSHEANYTDLDYEDEYLKYKDNLTLSRLITLYSTELTRRLQNG